MRVAYYSPLPPERSGIADYSYELLEELRHHVDLVAVVAEAQLGTARAPEGVELVGSSVAEDLVVDCNLYQMGNNSRYHKFLFGRAFEEPGLLVLHDPSLADFMAEMCGGAEGSIFRDELTYDCPEIGSQDDLPLVDVGDGRRDFDRLKVLFARRIIESNIRTLVHSSAMAKEMRRRYLTDDIQTIQLAAPVIGTSQGDDRHDQEFVFGVFGGINYYKRVRPLVNAFIEVRERHPRSRMVIAGRADDHLLERELRAVAARPELGGALEVKTELTLEALEQEMLSCDVGISLRWPTAGEMSATLMRTLGAGRPAIVSDVLQFRELDERYCWRATTDFDHEHEALVKLMGRAASNPQGCRSAGTMARAFVAREATYQVIAGQYVEHLEHCASRRAAARTALTRRSLRSTLPYGVNVICPSGGSEMAEAARRMTEQLRATGVDVVVVELPPTDSAPDRDSPQTKNNSELAEEGSPTERCASDAIGPARVGAQLGKMAEGDGFHIRRAIRSLDPADRIAERRGPHLVDYYFVEPDQADRYGRVAEVRRARGRRIVPILGPEAFPLSQAHGRILGAGEHILVPSAFAANVARLSTMLPVSIVPWPIDTKRAPDLSDHPKDAPQCRFLAVVPQGVSVAQANPFAAIAAYRQAFSNSERGSLAELVVVIHSASQRPEACEILRSELRAVGGRLVADPSPLQLGELEVGAQVHVSLHRAQAFGLKLADAMALSKVVLATGFSGNLDFMDWASSCLVGYEIRELSGGDHYLDSTTEVDASAGRTWVDPDVNDAAQWMRLLATNAGLRNRIGASASDRVRKLLAPELVGALARDVLINIAQTARVET